MTGPRDARGARTALLCLLLGSTLIASCSGGAVDLAGDSAGPGHGQVSATRPVTTPDVTPTQTFPTFEPPTSPPSERPPLPAVLRDGLTAYGELDLGSTVGGQASDTASEMTPAPWFDRIDAGGPMDRIIASTTFERAAVRYRGRFYVVSWNRGPVLVTNAPGHPTDSATALFSPDESYFGWVDEQQAIRLVHLGSGPTARAVRLAVPPVIADLPGATRFLGFSPDDRVFLWTHGRVWLVRPDGSDPQALPEAIQPTSHTWVHTFLPVGATEVAYTRAAAQLYTVLVLDSRLDDDGWGFPQGVLRATSPDGRFVLLGDDLNADDQVGPGQVCSVHTSQHIVNPCYDVSGPAFGFLPGHDVLLLDPESGPSPTRAALVDAATGKKAAPPTLWQRFVWLRGVLPTALMDSIDRLVRQS